MCHTFLQILAKRLPQRSAMSIRHDGPNRWLEHRWCGTSLWRGVWASLKGCGWRVWFNLNWIAAHRAFISIYLIFVSLFKRRSNRLTIAFIFPLYFPRSDEYRELHRITFWTNGLRTELTGISLLISRSQPFQSFSQVLARRTPE